MNNIHSSSSSHRSNNEHQPVQIAYDSLISELNSVLKTVSYTNYSIIAPIFAEYTTTSEELLSNILLTKNSDVVLSYGNNNYILGILIEHLLYKKYKLDSTCSYTTIKFNGYIHTTEDYVLKTICEKLNVRKPRAGFDNYQKSLFAYFDSAKATRHTDNHIIVIYYENFEHLMAKKKQILLYTLMELINNSHNILLIGFTSHYNLIDLMEKRIRSRFSQKTVYITVPTLERVFQGFEVIFKLNSTAYDSLHIASSLDIFRECLISDEYPDFVLLIQKYIHNGCSIVEILTKFKYILTLILAELKLHNEHGSAFVNKDDVTQIIMNVVNEIISNEGQGSYYHLLKNFPKLHITLLLCLCHCICDYKERITIGMIYKKYYEVIFKPNIGRIQKSKLDLTLVKKYFEELYNSNLISIKSDDKYGNIYELKLPVCEMKKIICSLENVNKLDDDMKRMCESIK